MSLQLSLLTHQHTPILYLVLMQSLGIGEVVRRLLLDQMVLLSCQQLMCVDCRIAQRCADASVPVLQLVITHQELQGEVKVNVGHVQHGQTERDGDEGGSGVSINTAGILCLGILLAIMHATIAVISRSVWIWICTYTCICIHTCDAERARRYVHPPGTVHCAAIHNTLHQVPCSCRFSRDARHGSRHER